MGNNAEANIPAPAGPVCSAHSEGIGVSEEDVSSEDRILVQVDGRREVAQIQLGDPKVDEEMEETRPGGLELRTKAE